MNIINRKKRAQHEAAYQQCRINEYGITLDEFMKRPQETLNMLGQGDALEIIESGYRPLLPKQAAIRARLDAEWLVSQQRKVVVQRDDPVNQSIFGVCIIHGQETRPLGS